MTARTEAERMARSFHVLGDPACLRLLELLAAAERTSEECAAYLSATDEHLQYYLRMLQSSGWITASRHGGSSSYRLADPRAVELIALARTMAAENSGALAECTQLDRRRS